MSSSSNRGQVNSSAAEVYESFFLRALFQQFAAPMCDAARLAPGQRVLDVACGTGVLARAAAERVGAKGRVTGADVSEIMLAVARRTNPSLEWRQCPAEALAFDARSFDAVTCQFGLMFFTDRVTTHEGTARFESIDAWVHINIKGWTLADLIDDLQLEQLLTAARAECRCFVQADGSVVFRAPAHIVTAAGA